MAVVEIYQSREVPQARVSVPSGENSLAEQFGRGLQELGQAGTQLAFDIKRADEIKQERDWQADQPKIAKEIAQAGIDFATFYADAKAKAPADLSGLQDQVDKWWDDRKAGIAKNFSNPRAQSYIDLHTTDLKGQGIASAIQDSTTATIRVRGDNIQAVVDLAASGLSSNPGGYKAAIANVMATLDAQEGVIPEATLNEWRVAARRSLTSAMIGGQIGSNPNQALIWLNSGEYDADLDPQEKVRLINQAEAQAKYNAVEAKQQSDDALHVRQADMGLRLRNAISTLQETGVMPIENGKPLLTEKQIIDTWPGAEGEQYLHQFQVAQQIGQARGEIKSNTWAQDQTLRESLEPKPGEEFTPEQAQKREILEKAITLKWERIAADPGAAVITPGGKLAENWALYAKLRAAGDPTAAWAGRRAVAATVAAERALGIPEWQIKPLSNAQAQTYAFELNTASPEDHHRIANEIADLGENALGQVMAAGAPPNTAVFAAVDDPIWTKKLMDAGKTQPDALTGMMKGYSRADVETAVAREMEQFLGTLPTPTGSVYLKAATDVAMQNVAKGMPLDDAAIDGAAPFTQGYHISGKLRIPADREQEVIEQGLARTIDSLVAGEPPFDVVPPPSGLPGLTAEQEMLAFRDGLRKGSYQWLTNEDGSGAILTLPNGRWVMTEDGRRVTVSFDVAEKLGKETPISKAQAANAPSQGAFLGGRGPLPPQANAKP